MNNLPHGASAVTFWSRELLVWGIMSEGLVSVARRGYSDDCSDDDNYGECDSWSVSVPEGDSERAVSERHISTL